jgi:hypothetical protein
MDRLHTALLATFVAGNQGLDSFDARLRRRGERGSVTIEYVLWAVAVIAIVGIVVAAVKAYVTSQAGNIK